MRELLLLLSLTAAVSPARALDGEVAGILLVVLSGVSILFALLALVALLCVCARCCRACQGGDCTAFNYTDDDDYLGTEYTTRSWDQQHRHRGYSRDRSHSPRKWEGRNEDMQYAEGYRNREEKHRYRSRPFVLVKDLGYGQQPPNNRVPVHQPGYGRPVPGNAPARNYQPHELNPEDLRDKPWYNDVQRVINE